MSKPNLVFLLGFVQNDERINKSKVLVDKYANKRKFFSCKQEVNYVSYVDRGCKDKVNYIAYSGNGEKSLGVFNKNGLMDKQGIKDLKKSLRETKSVIWHGVLSFESEFGQKHMCDNDTAINLIQREFPKFFKNAGLRLDNMEWYGALHENTFNRHIHFSFYEKAPCRYTSRNKNSLHHSEGHISRVAIDKFKVSVEQNLTDMSSDIKTARSAVTDLAKYILFTAQSNKLHLGKVQKDIVKLIDLLPKEGRLQYDSDDMAHLRPQIKLIVQNLIKTNPTMYKAFTELTNAIATKDRNTKEILKSQSIEEKYWKYYLVADKTMEDIYRKLGNYVINTARVFRDKNNKDTKVKAIVKRYRRQSVAGLLSYCLRLSGDIENEGMNAFREYMDKLKQMEKEKETNMQMQREQDYSMG